MKYVKCLVIMSLLCSFVSPGDGEVIGQNDQEVQEIAGPILDNLLAGFNAGDYQKYSRDFDDSLKEAISEKKFQQVRENILKGLGKYKSRHYLGFLKKDKMTAVLWKGVFDKTEDDVLIKLVLSQRKDKNLVVGLWFQ